MRRPPYLPFLSGPADTHPGLSPISEAGWLLPDVEADWIIPKRALMQERRGAVYASVSTTDAPREAGLLVTQTVGAVSGAFQSYIEHASAAVSDDLCVMERIGGEWCLTEASLCSPTFWRLGDMIGRPLYGLHGAVPGGAHELAGRIARIFGGLQTGQILERFNWTLQAGAERFTPSAAPLKQHAAKTPDSDALDVLHLRVERQTIRKLPESGAVLFTIRISLDPLSSVLSEEGAKKALMAAWAQTAPELAAYKGWPAYDRLVQAALT